MFPAVTVGLVGGHPLGRQRVQGPRGPMPSPSGGQVEHAERLAAALQPWGSWGRVVGGCDAAHGGGSTSPLDGGCTPACLAQSAPPPHMAGAPNGRLVYPFLVVGSPGLVHAPQGARGRRMQCDRRAVCSSPLPWPAVQTPSGMRNEGVGGVDSPTLSSPRRRWWRLPPGGDRWADGRACQTSDMMVRIQ